MVCGLTNMVEMISSLHKDIDGKHVSQGLGVLFEGPSWGVNDAFHDAFLTLTGIIPSLSS